MHMNKRVDQKKKRNQEYVGMLKRVLGITFCIMLLVFSISAADMSTRRMIMCNDDKYALAVSLQQDNMLRIDIAGEKFMLNIKPVIRIAEDVSSGPRSYYESLVKIIREKIER